MMLLVVCKLNCDFLGHEESKSNWCVLIHLFFHLKITVCRDLMVTDLFTDMAAILNKFDLRIIIGCPGGHEHISSVFSSAFRDIFS